MPIIMFFLLIFNITLVRGNTSNPSDFKDIDDAISQVGTALTSTNAIKIKVLNRVNKSSENGLLKEIIKYKEIQEKVNKLEVSKSFINAMLKFILLSLKTFKSTQEALEREISQQQLIETLTTEINSLKKLCRNKDNIAGTRRDQIMILLQAHNARDDKITELKKQIKNLELAIDGKKMDTETSTATSSGYS